MPLRESLNGPSTAVETASREHLRVDDVRGLVAQVLTEAKRNDEVADVAAQLPYSVVLGPDGALRRVEFGSILEDGDLLFEIDEDVFPPDFGMTTQMLTEEAVRRYPQAQRVLEMGAGSGFPGITFAARSKALEHLVLADIHGPAVACARKNVQRNRGLMPPASRVDLVQSDLYESVDPGFKPQLVLHNQVFYPDNGRLGLNEDGGEMLTKRFLLQSRGRLAPGGVVLMNFASFVDAKHDPHRIAPEMGFDSRIIAEKQSRDGAVAYVYEMRLR